MKIEIGKHYLIRQRWQYGSDRHDDIIVIKVFAPASKEEAETYQMNRENSYWGDDVRNGARLIFELKEVISPIRID